MRSKRWLSFVLSCTFLAALLVANGPANAFASSDYGVSTTNELHLGGVGDPRTCNEADINMGTNWQQIMQPATPSTPYSYQNTWNWSFSPLYGGGEDGTLQHFVDRFNNSFTSTTGRGWAVSQASQFDTYTVSQPEFETYHQMIRIWAFDPDTAFTVQDGQLLANKTVYYTDYLLNPNAGCRWQAWQYREVAGSWIDLRYNKLLFVNAQSITYPVDYTGKQIPSEYTPPAPEYVAMGDSFSSGEGNPSFEAGTDQNGVNECHRSPSAYPRLLQADPMLRLGVANFVACSGAQTSDVLHGGASTGSWNESPQVSALTLDTKVVTITIGGNDVGFKAFATACTVSLCNFNTEAYSTISNKIANELPAKLGTVYAKINSLTSSTAKIYVVGYPHVTPAQMPTGQGSACFPFNTQLDDSDPTRNDGATAYAVTNQLNTVIETAVQSVGSLKFKYVDPNDANSPFIDHDWCKIDRYFQQVFLNQLEYSYHPNVNGQLAYSAIIKSYL